MSLLGKERGGKNTEKKERKSKKKKKKKPNSLDPIFIFKGTLFQ